MAHLLLITLGPIQDFIASARRCQDLWFGSWLLSELARSVAEATSQAAGGDEALIFPASLSGSGERAPSVANKILLYAEGDAGAVRRIAEAGREAMQARLQELREGFFKRVSGSSHFQGQVAAQQVDAMMEYLWVAVPSTGDYGADREAAEALLARRKNSRTWGAVEWAPQPGVPKSSLDGARESVIHEKLYEDLQRLERQGKVGQAAQLRQRFGIRGMERLCGVGLLKRLGVDPNAKDFFKKKRPAFHSTGHVAVAPLLARLAGEGEGREAVRALLDALEENGLDLARLKIEAGALEEAWISDLAVRAPFADLAEGWEEGDAPPEGMLAVPRTFHQRGGAGYDGSMLFEHPNRIRESFDEAIDANGEAVSEEAVRQIQKEIRCTLKGLGVKEPPPYYAFLLADGDRMGKALDAVKERARHRQIGEALEAFSARCEKIVARAGGSLIYAGGDDVLAILPLHTALQCAWHLRCAFKDAITPCFPDREALQATDGDLKLPTLSVGIGIAHHMDPMDEARALAKRAEKKAKESGRNALAIVLSKRSGPTLEIAGSWDGDWEEGLPLHERLAHWVRLLATDALPDKTAFELADAVRVWKIGTPDMSDPASRDAVKALLRRAVMRRRKERARDNAVIDREQRDALRSGIDHPNPLAAAERISAELQIARLLLSARNAAFDAPTPDPEEEHSA